MYPIENLRCCCRRRRHFLNNEKVSGSNNVFEDYARPEPGNNSFGESFLDNENRGGIIKLFTTRTRTNK